MDDTPNLKLPYIMAAQAQKHVTHNEAIRALDAIVQIGIADRDLTTPPGSPAEGASYIVADSATGAWVGKDHQIAAWQDGAWAFYAPREGWLVWAADEDVLLAWDGAAWTAAGAGAGAFTDLSDAPASYSGAGGTLAVVSSDETGLEFSAQVPLLGINTAADATNKLAIASDASLFSHAGGGHQHKINKSAGSDTASLLFQTGFSGRAEMGTTGDDDFHFKVSADGTTWIEAIVLDKDTGSVGIGTDAPSGVLSVGSVAGSDAYFFFDNADIDNDADGQSLYVYRRAAEGDNYIRIFTDANRAGKIVSDGLLQISSGFTSFVGTVDFLSGALIGQFAGNQSLLHFGTITAAGGQRYVQWQVDDSDDHFRLTREDANILGFAVDMPLKLASYAVSGLPSAGVAGQIIYVSDETGGAVPAFSDGTNWRRVTDRAVVS